MASTKEFETGIGARRNLLLQFLLVFVGLLSCIGYVLDIQPIRGLGFATVASPLPLVFSHFRGHEAFTNNLTVQLTTRSGVVVEEKVDYRVFSSMAGPYNRRNAYGAVISFGPFFTTERELLLRDSVLKYGFCHPAPLLQAYGLTEALSSAKIFVRPRLEGKAQSWMIPVNCQG